MHFLPCSSTKEEVVAHKERIRFVEEIANTSERDWIRLEDWADELFGWDDPMQRESVAV